jgi:cytoskeletal protein CcmA (bactofilin family)
MAEKKIGSIAQAVIDQAGGESLFWDSLEILEHQHWLASSFRGRGDLEFSGHLRFSGSWKGSVRARSADAHLFVRAGAKIFGRIQSPMVTIEGELDDIEIIAENIRVLSGAKVFGKLTARNMIVDEGAILQGRIHIDRKLRLQQIFQSAESLTTGTENPKTL